MKRTRNDVNELAHATFPCVTVTTRNGDAHAVIHPSKVVFATCDVNTTFLAGYAFTTNRLPETTHAYQPDTTTPVIASYAHAGGPWTSRRAYRVDNDTTLTPDESLHAAFDAHWDALMLTHDVPHLLAQALVVKASHLAAAAHYDQERALAQLSHRVDATAKAEAFLARTITRAEAPPARTHHA